jgi:hypothetical protein
VTRPAPSTQLRTPTPEDTNEGKLVYIAALERRLLFYILRDIKMRAALELATGVPYDKIDFSTLSYDDLKEMIAQDMARGLNLPIEEARSRVLNNQILSSPE